MFFSNLAAPQISKRIEKFNLFSRPVIAVIMSVFNHWQYTRDALNSYFLNLDKHHHYIIVVIDDCSSDQTQDYLVSEIQHHEEIVYLRFKDNGGLTRSWNYGVHYAISHLHADYIFLANNDILIPKGALDLLVEGLEKTGKNALIGPLTNSPGIHQKTQDIRIYLPKYQPSNSPQEIENTSKQVRSNPLQEVAGINGFFWGGHRETFISNILWSFGQTAYYFNPLNRNFRNEEEFQRRLLNKGGRAILAANSFIFHYKDISMKRVESGRISPQWIYRPS